MREIILDCPFGDERKTVRICEVSGAHGGMYYISLNGFHEGRVWFTEHYGWRHDAPVKSELTTEDFYIIVDLIIAKDQR